jgi:hypothetical protein
MAASLPKRQRWLELEATLLIIPCEAYGVMESGRIRARAIAKTPNSVSAPSPKFQRVRRVDSIEVVRRLMKADSIVPRRSPGTVFALQRYGGHSWT